MRLASYEWRDEHSPGALLGERITDLGGHPAVAAGQPRTALQEYPRSGAAGREVPAGPGPALAEVSFDPVIPDPASTPLDAGDVIVTRTPAGVGLFMDPPASRTPGDLVEVDISGIGTLSNQMAQEAPMSAATDLHEHADPGLRRPNRLHHNAFVTTDLEATRHFYEDVIGMPLVATWAEVDHTPDRDRVYCHTFFELSDGSALAFFQFDDPGREPPVARQTSPSVHIALNCDESTQRDILDRLRSAGYSETDAYLRDHGYCLSLYVHDPNGLRLEFTVDIAQMPQIMAEQRATAHQTLKRWLAGDHASNNTYRPEHH